MSVNLPDLTHLIFLLPVMLVWSAIYMFPTILATLRSHRKIESIALINVLLGWTIAGWVAVLIWACKAPQAIVAETPES
jgi:hypothetical protein